MKALVYKGPGKKASEQHRPRPDITAPRDAIVKITYHFKLDAIMDAYDAFGAAAKIGALKAIIEA